MHKIILTLLLVFISFNSMALEKINGAGATFPYPLYSKWFAEYKKLAPNVEFNYQSIGSGGGVKQVQAETVDFGASDSPMSAEELKKAKVPVMHIPSTLGAIVIAYNQKNIPNHLKLDGATVAGIFEGKINKWNAPEIVKNNPGLNLPDEDILVIRRSDGSGTTANFTEYLSSVSESWKTNFGKGKSVRWKTGIGAKGNEGVTAMISQIEGSLGYVELAYALNNELKVSAIKNTNGDYIIPTIESISKAGLSLDIKSGNLTKSIINSSLSGAYPIAAYTYLLIPEKTKKDSSLMAFLKWAITDGQAFASKLLYAPLPPELSAKLLENLKALNATK